MSQRRVVFSVLGLALTGFIVSDCGSGSNTPVTPTATPTPAPIATPTPAPAAFVCPLPPSSKANPGDCYVGVPTLTVQINTAIDRTMATRPELFNFSDMAGGNPRVLNRDAYWLAVKHELENQGVCVVIEKEELAVKNQNAFNEQWNVWASSGAADCTRDTCLGFVRRKYVTSCAPSWF
jgi:hypothetical protein